MPKLANQATFVLTSSKRSGEDNIIIQDQQIGLIHAITDQPGAEFDLIVRDSLGEIKYEKRGIKNESDRWGERIDLPVSDNYCKIEVENVKGAEKIDVFIE